MIVCVDTDLYKRAIDWHMIVFEFGLFMNTYFFIQTLFWMFLTSKTTHVNS